MKKLWSTNPCGETELGTPRVGEPPVTLVEHDEDGDVTRVLIECPVCKGQSVFPVAAGNKIYGDCKTCNSEGFVLAGDMAALNRDVKEAMEGDS